MDAVAKIKELIVNYQVEEVPQTKIASQHEVRRNLDQWITPIQAELESLFQKKGALRVISEEEVKRLLANEETEVLPSRMVYTVKPSGDSKSGKMKARLVACGKYAEHSPQKILQTPKRPSPSHRRYWIQCPHTHQLLGLLLVYVDDHLVLGEGDALDSTIKVIQSKCETSTPEEIDDENGVRFLGTEIFSQQGKWWMTQSNYSMDLLARHLGPDADQGVPKKLPMIVDPQLRGSLGYLAATVDHGRLFENPPDENQLNIYTDASFGEVFIGCHLIMWGTSILPWKSEKQAVVTASTAETELVEALEGALAGDALWVVLEDVLGIKARAISYIRTITAALAIVTGDSGSWRARHLKKRANIRNEPKFIKVIGF
eukprot:s116_g15.t1